MTALVSVDYLEAVGSLGLGRDGLLGALDGAACGCIACRCAKRTREIVRRAPSRRLRAGERLQREKHVGRHRKRARITGGPSQGPEGADAFSHRIPRICGVRIILVTRGGDGKSKFSYPP